MPLLFLDVDPRTLHVPPSRLSGADPFKLQQQIARFGAGTAGMPPPWVYRGSDGALLIYNGVTRATRIARLAPGIHRAARKLNNRPRGNGEPATASWLSRRHSNVIGANERVTSSATRAG